MMRLINDVKKVSINDKVTVEITLRELAIIHAVLGCQSNYTTQGLIQQSQTIKPDFKNQIERGINGSIYRDTLTILREKGICGESL